MNGVSLNTSVRYPAVAGLFYPEDASALRELLVGLLANVKLDVKLPSPKALLVPHAGYPYSGPVAAAAYSLEVTEIARQNSGDTAGDVLRVVGYGAFAIHESRRHTAQ